METWFVEFPTYKYVEDVKELAKKAGLRIIDAKFQGKQKQCAKPPKLTLKEDQYRPKRTRVSKSTKKVEEK